MSAPLLIPWFRWEPIVLEIPLRDGELILYPFQLLVGVALLVGLGVAVLFAHKHQRSIALTLDLAVHLLLFAAPISYLLNGLLYEPETFSRLMEDPSSAPSLRLGWSMAGGIIGSIVGAIVWKWRRKASILAIGDAFAFAGPFGWCIARIGCFVVHDHPGRVSQFFLAVADFQVGEPPFQARHDLGLYGAIVLFGIAVIFLILSRKPHKPGFYVGVLAVLHSPCRFFLDFLRAPAGAGGDIRYAGLTPAQYASIALFVAGVLVIRHVQRSPSELS